MSTPTFAVSPTTKKVFENFSGLAEQVILVEGNVQRLKGAGGAILAAANLPEAWPKEVGIYNFGRFLNTLNLFEKPAIQFNAADSLLIQNDSKSANWQVKFTLSDTSTIEHPPARSFAVDDPAVTLNLSKHALDCLDKATRQLELDAFTLAIEKDRVRMLSANAKNPHSHVFEFTIPEVDVTRRHAGFERSLRFKVEHFTLFAAGDYEVLIGDKWSYAFLANKALPISYYVAEYR